MLKRGLHTPPPEEERGQSTRAPPCGWVVSQLASTHRVCRTDSSCPPERLDALPGSVARHKSTERAAAADAGIEAFPRPRSNARTLLAHVMIPSLYHQQTPTKTRQRERGTDRSRRSDFRAPSRLFLFSPLLGIRGAAGTCGGVAWWCDDVRVSGVVRPPTGWTTPQRPTSHPRERPAPTRPDPDPDPRPCRRAAPGPQPPRLSLAPRTRAPRRQAPRPPPAPSSSLATIP